MAQHQRVGEAVREMVKTAERIGESMDAGDRRIREGEPGEMRAEQHRRARLEIARLLDQPSAGCAEQPQALRAPSASDSGFLSRADV